MTLYILAAVLAFCASGCLAFGASAIFSLALSGIAGTMHGVESNALWILVILAVIAVVCLAAFIICLIKYIKVCIIERVPKKITLSILLFVVLLPVFTVLLLNIIFWG